MSGTVGGASEEQTVWQRFPGLSSPGKHVGVPCSYCQAKVGEECVQGSDGWPDPAKKPHAARVSAAHLIGWWEAIGRDAQPTS